MILCRLGLHRWSRLGTSTWLRPPSLAENSFGVAMEYRTCERCSRVRDVSTWFDAGDADLGVPNGFGPIAAQRVREIMAGPRKPLADPPIPLS